MNPDDGTAGGDAAATGADEGSDPEVPTELNATGRGRVGIALLLFGVALVGDAVAGGAGGALLVAGGDDGRGSSPRPTRRTATDRVPPTSVYRPVDPEPF
jgi:hypothetical protein